ncbi:MAG TPA: DUF1800 family protein [Acidimicrobiales bacterium]|nr:DUF1800 family protein [Acidimicrobiales bacterium]
MSLLRIEGRVAASEQARVAHVLRRLGFGPVPGEVEAAVAAGGASALVDSLLAQPTTTAADWAWPAQQGNWEDRDRWLTRLFALWARSPGQVQERVSWILSGLLVAGTNDTVQFADITDHHNRLRAWPSAGSYRSLLQAVAKSATMQKYLTGVFSVPPHPNENLARELMELFSLGVTHAKSGADNYTEADVKEIARSLTGYRLDWNTGVVSYDSRYWDGGSKTFLGATRGAAALPAVIDAIATQDAYKYFVPQRMYRELIGVDPSAGVLDRMATVWGASGNLKALVRHIAHLPEFLADTTIGNRVKSPVELLVSAMKVLDVDDVSGWSLDWVTNVMRQNPIAPPDVSGWDPAWLHPSHLVIWSQFQNWFCWADRGPDADGTADATPAAQHNKTIRKLFAEANRATAADTALRLAGLHDVSPQTRGAIDAYAKASAWTSEPWSFDRACGVMQMVFDSPEFLVS